MRTRDITQLVFNRDDINKLSKIDRRLFFMSGLIFNELSFLSKLTRMTNLDKCDDPYMMNMQAAQYGIINRILAGKLYETWGFFKKNKILIETKYLPLMNDRDRTDFQEIKNYFSVNKNLLEHTRNQAAFHYQDDNFRLEDSYNSLGDNENWSFYINPVSINNFYSLSELVLTKSLVDHHAKLGKSGDIYSSLSALINESSIAIRPIASFLESLIGAIVISYNFNVLNQIVHKIEVHDINQLRLPFYSEDYSRAVVG